MSLSHLNFGFLILIFFSLIIGIIQSTSLIDFGTDFFTILYGVIVVSGILLALVEFQFFPRRGAVLGAISYFIVRLYVLLSTFHNQMATFSENFGYYREGSSALIPFRHYWPMISAALFVFAAFTGFALIELFVGKIVAAISAAIIINTVAFTGGLDLPLFSAFTNMVLEDAHPILAWVIALIWLVDIFISLDEGSFSYPS